jgi:DNA-binding NtrC family response regulator
MNLRKKPSLDSSRIFVFGDTKRRESDIIPILNSLGYTVHQGEAPGKTDLKAARNANPDLVMVELAAEHMTEGFALSDRVRAQLACPVIFLCGAGAGRGIPAEKLSLPHGYLERPFSETDVQRLVEITRYTARLEKSRRTAETAREEAESHYHLLADNLEDVIFKLDVNLNYTYISPSV